MSDLVPARRVALNEIGSGSASHAGLVIDRYLEFAKSPDSVAALMAEAQAASRRTGAVYRVAFASRAGWVREAGSGAVEFQLSTPASQRIVVGLGGESPIETHLSLHRVYGTPLVPGSAVKGVAAHYAREVLRLDSLSLSVIFGQPTDDRSDAGFVRFHDAWIVPESLTAEGEGLLADTMTPHHSNYNSGKAGRDGKLIDATDFDDPNPIRFFSVRGTFSFVLETIDLSPQGREWLVLGRRIVELALADWGVGAKSSSGYGRLLTAAAIGQMKNSGPKHAPALKPSQIVDVRVVQRLPAAIKVVHEASGSPGQITNWRVVPAAIEVGSVVTVKVGAVLPETVNFMFQVPPDPTKKGK